MKLRFLLPDLTRPLTRVFRRGTGRWLQMLGGGAARADETWRHAPRRYRVIYNPDVRAYVSVDLAEWYGRLHYYTGAYVDRTNSYLIRTYLGPGDTFVDVGGHHGMHTVCAAGVVGPGGRVVTFDPNPVNCDLIRAHLTINRLTNATIHNLGLSDADAELRLNISDSSRASFLDNEPASSHVDVAVRRGDDILNSESVRGGRVLVKIDTEGFEHRVIRGMRSFLDGLTDVAVFAEITDKWLRSAGSSTEELFREMSAMGFAPYDVKLKRSGPRRRPKVELAPLTGPLDVWQYDVLFAKPAFLKPRAPPLDYRTPAIPV